MTPLRNSLRRRDFFALPVARVVLGQPSTQTHWAIVQGSGTVRDVGGVQAFTVAETRMLVAPPTSIVLSDNYSAPAQPLLGYLDDLRVTKGICRYPGGMTFTLPIAAIPDS